MKNIYNSLIDLLIVSLAFYLSLYFAIEDISNRYEILNLFLIYFYVYIVCFFIFNLLYKNVDVIYKFFSAKDLIQLIKTVIFSNLAYIVLIFLYDRLEDIPRFNLVYNIVLSGFFLSLLRLIPRLLYFRKFKNQDNLKKTILIGNEIDCYKFIKFNESRSNLQIVGLILLDSQFTGSIRGVSILKDIDSLTLLLENNRLNVDQILITTNDLKSNLSEFYLLTRKFNLNIYNVKFAFNNNTQDNFLLDEVNIENFLSRPVKLIEDSKYYNFYEKKNILITGCGGSIGSQIVKELLKYNPNKIYGLDISEENIFDITQQISKIGSLNKCKFFVTDINNSKKIKNLIYQCKPEIIIHAAAIKHVSISEENCDVAINTNIFGTTNILECFEKYDFFKDFIFVSTDKAVNPSSLMGMTKFLAENICRAYAQKLMNKNFTIVRFGNVLASSGSVVPIFKEQIRNNGPVTVSDSNVERYFMLINEACSLILLAGTLNMPLKDNNIKTYMLDMGEPVKIIDLAKKMISLSSVDKNNIKIVTTGLKKGEKLSEELFYSYEKPKKLDKFPIFELNKSNLPEDFKSSISKLDNELRNDEFNQEKLKKIVEEISKQIILFNEI